MPTSTITTLANSFKNFYLNALVYQINEQASPLLAQIEKSSEKIQGTKIVFGVRYGVSGGIGNIADDGDFPEPNARKTKQLETGTKNFFGTVRVTDKAILASRGDRGSFGNGMVDEMEEIETDMKKVMSRQIMGDGTGLLATVTAVSSSSTTHTCTVDTTANLDIGMIIDVYTSTTKDTSETEITLVDDVLSKVVFVATTAPEVGDLIYTQNSKGMELTGLKSVMTADNTIYGLDRTANLWFNPTIQAISGPFDELLIKKGMDLSRRRTGVKHDFLICDDGIERAYIAYKAASKVTVGDMSDKIKGGFGAIDFNGTPLTVDFFATPGELVALRTSDWALYQLNELEWMEQGGQILKLLEDKPIYQATLRKYCDLCCKLPRGQVKFTGITPM